jgi:GntR family transcriptional regulator/MocR family aminotransferase
VDEPSCPAPVALDAPPGMLMLSLGLPDARLFPSRALARAFRRALGQRQRALLSYADPSGHVRLRTQLAAMLVRTRGLPVSADNVMVTRSIEQAIDLVARLLLKPGDAVAVEAFGFPPAWSVLRLAGARLVPVPIDRQGFDVAAFETLLARERFRAVFLTPHHQFPTGSVMSAARRSRLAELASAHNFAILEDDYDHEFHYAGKPILPIAAGPGRGNVIYMGSLSNLLSPGVTSAFVTARPEVFQPLLRLRAASDSRGDAAMECAVAELFEDGELLRHMRRMRKTYASRRDALAAALRHHLAGALDFRLPEGGTAIWARAAPDIDVSSWATAGLREGVLFADSSRYDFHGRDASFVRLGYSYHDELELAEAVRRMARALMRVRAPRIGARPRAEASGLERAAAAAARPAIALRSS